MECTYDNLWQHIPYFAGSIVILLLTDGVLWLTKKNRSRWFKLHVLTNAVTCITSYPDFINTFRDPLMNPHALKSSLVPPNMTLALHLYHMVMFSNLTVVDWVHHIVMMTILSLTFICPNPAMTNYAIFIVNGLPGGIDYFLLILVKEGIIDRLLEKRINSKLNIWLRGPGILIGAYIIFIQWCYQIITYDVRLLSIVILGLYWNAQYFTERVVYNWGHHSDTSIPNIC